MLTIKNIIFGTIDVYVMSPDDRLLESNLEKRDMLCSMGRIKRDIEEQLEFPNPAEGFEHIYKVAGSECTLVMKESNPAIVDIAHKELEEEEAYIREKELEKQERKKILDSMMTRKFWHYCEVCGKKNFITAKEAYDSGWDYPPLIGAFKMLSPRTCGDCPMAQTLFHKVHSQQSIPIVMENNLTKEELIVWERIKGEPESLLD